MIFNYRNFLFENELNKLVSNFNSINEGYNTGDEVELNPNVTEWNIPEDGNHDRNKVIIRKLSNQVKKFINKTGIKTKEEGNRLINTLISKLSNSINNKKVRLSILYILISIIVSTTIMSTPDIIISNDNIKDNPNIEIVVNKINNSPQVETPAPISEDTMNIIKKLKKKKIDKLIPTENEKLLDNLLPNADTVNKNFDQFLYDLAKRESDGDWKEKGGYYVGLWQMGYPARQDAGYDDIKTKSFKEDPNIFPPNKQLDAITKYLKIIENRYMKKHISKYDGTTINGIPITRSGIVAASHLIGYRYVKKYLDSGGKKLKKDGNKVSLEEYMMLFHDYNLGI